MIERVIVRIKKEKDANGIAREYFHAESNVPNKKYPPALVRACLACVNEQAKDIKFWNTQSKEQYFSTRVTFLVFSAGLWSEGFTPDDTRALTALRS